MDTSCQMAPESIPGSSSIACRQVGKVAADHTPVPPSIAVHMAAEWHIMTHTVWQGNARPERVYCMQSRHNVFVSSLTAGMLATYRLMLALFKSGGPGVCRNSRSIQLVSMLCTDIPVLIAQMNHPRHVIDTWAYCERVHACICANRQAGGWFKQAGCKQAGSCRRGQASGQVELQANRCFPVDRRVGRLADSSSVYLDCYKPAVQLCNEHRPMSPLPKLHIVS